jgi:hypothetical protein
MSRYSVSEVKKISLKFNERNQSYRVKFTFGYFSSYWIEFSVEGSIIAESNTELAGLTVPDIFNMRQYAQKIIKEIKVYH